MSSDRFVISEDGLTVRDIGTGLVWQRKVPTKVFIWAAAKKYAAAFDLDGGGWRLPTVEELSGLVNYDRRGPAIDGAAFPDTPSEWFWTDTPVAGVAGHAWNVNFHNGPVYFASTGVRSRVRCVR